MLGRKRIIVLAVLISLLIGLPVAAITISIVYYKLECMLEPKANPCQAP